MNNRSIRISELNKAEALRYMGAGDGKTNEILLQILKECEEDLLAVIRPKFVYRIFDKSELKLPGDDIKRHLKDCEKAALLCATISGEADRLIRKVQINDMTYALAIDTLASVAVEQVCEKAEQVIKDDLPSYNLTWRYGVGYGDLPLTYQSEFLKLVNAFKQIGVSVTKNNILIPRKSVTCFIGLSEGPITKGLSGCSTCNMRDRCKFRKRGEHCGI